MIEQFSSKLSETYSDLWEFIPGLIIALGVVLFFILLGKLVFVLFRKILDKRWKDSLLAGFIANVIKWAVYLIGFSAGLDIVGYGSILSGILAGAGIGAIIIGFAFKDIGENFLAGILLAFNRPFSTGDIIEVEGHKGTVRDLTLRAVHIRNAEGKDFYIPTSSILKNTLINYTRDGMLRLDFFIGISPEDDIETVRILVLQYLKNNMNVLKSPAPNVITKELGEFTVDLQVLFWVDILMNRTGADSDLGHTIRSKVITDVKGILDKAGVSMPSQVLEHKMYRTEKFKFENDAGSNYQ